MKKFLSIAILMALSLSILSAQKASKKEKKEKNTYEGEFQSLKGVMNQLSCYCYNCGYITTDAGKKIAVCFEGEEVDITCARIKVKGKFVTKKIGNEGNGACSSGEMSLLMVKSHTCL